MTVMLKLSDVIRSGTVAGIKAGDSYEEIVKVLGPSELFNLEEIYPGCQYGDLEIYFHKAGKDLVSHLVYLNSGYRDIRIDSKLPFDNEGLRWGMKVKDVCGWLINHAVPFSYDPLRNCGGWPQDLNDGVDLALSDSRYCLIRASSGLSEIYLSHKGEDPEANSAQEMFA